VHPEYQPAQRVEFTITTRTLVRVLLVLTGFLLMLDLIWSVRQVLTWILVAIFFTVALNPPVAALERRGLGRKTASLIVFGVTVLLLLGFFAALLTPLYDQLKHFVDHLPANIDSLARSGPLKDHPAIARKLHQEAATLPSRLPASADSLLGIASTVVTALVNIATVMFLTLFLLLELPTITRFFLDLLAPDAAERLLAMEGDVTTAVSRYVAANLFVSVICATVSGVSLYLLGVPGALVLALLSGFFDIIPLVGATIGGVLVCLVAFAHSTTAGIAMIIIYNVYQQIENHLIQPVVMRKSVQVSPFITLVAVLVGSTLLGIIGALLAIPAAATIQIALREVVAERMRRVEAVRAAIEAPEEEQPTDSTHDYVTAETA
jgi:predicted PurR-regulated permease PerM